MSGAVTVDIPASIEVSTAPVVMHEGMPFPTQPVVHALNSMVRAHKFISHKIYTCKCFERAPILAGAVLNECMSKSCPDWLLRRASA